VLKFFDSFGDHFKSPSFRIHSAKLPRVARNGDFAVFAGRLGKFAATRSAG
jgi:hypothetical protein